jgi:hypothetical protein
VERYQYSCPLKAEKDNPRQFYGFFIDTVVSIEVLDIDDNSKKGNDDEQGCRC